MLSADALIARLGLVPHAQEGGHFVETYRSRDRIALGDGVTRACSTAIYYLLRPDTCSAVHRLRYDEVFHFYLGDPVEMLQLDPDGAGRVITLGTDLEAGMTPQAVVPAGTWQGSRLAPGGRVALLGTTVAPGFEPEDYETGERAALIAGWPTFRATIEALTPAAR